MTSVALETIKLPAMAFAFSAELAHNRFCGMTQWAAKPARQRAYILMAREITHFVI
jgi:hypothetical protein